MVAIKHIVASVLASAAGHSSIVQQIDTIRGVLTHCNISQDVDRLNLVPVHNQIVPPSNLTLNFVGLAFGVQNYTCTQNNNFTYVSSNHRAPAPFLTHRAVISAPSPSCSTCRAW